jgi:hypothetical protein
MSLISYIEKLRTKPEADRKKISIGVAFGVTGIIFIVWLFTIVSNISHRTAVDVVVSDADSVSVYTELKANWGALVENVSTLFSKSNTPSEGVMSEALYFDALEGVPADTVEVDTVGGSLESTVSE